MKTEVNRTIQELTDHETVKTTLIRYVLFICSGFLSIGLLVCAKQLPPPGGPVDKQGPEIIATLPAPNSTNVPLDADIELRFSERVNPVSVKNSLFISPRPRKMAALKWKGARLIIDFSDSLQANRTYVLTIGTETEDLRRNKLKKSFHLAFSTGDHLDAGRISGRVYEETTQRVLLIGAYLLDSENHPDPSKVAADYLTQCDEQGAYQFSYLSPGIYRLFAFSDKDADNKYDRCIETIGITTTDVEIHEENLSIENLNFRITKEDTIAPIIKSLRVYDRHHVELRFDETMRKAPDPRQHFTIVPKDKDGSSIEIGRVIHSHYDGSRIQLTTALPMSDVFYYLEIDSLVDVSGNMVDSTYRRYEFKGSALPDTVRPKVIFRSMNDKTRTVPLEVQLRFVFSEALICSTLENHLILQDSNDVSYPGDFYWLDATDVTFKPRKELIGETDYIVRIAADSVYDEFGNSAADSSINIRFRTLNEDTLSAILGDIRDDKVNADGRIYMYAVQVGEKKLVYETRVDGDGPYKFENILPGTYLINGFRDENGDHEYTYGIVFPYSPAERFFYYPDSIKVRAKWANEGNDIIISRY